MSKSLLRTGVAIAAIAVSIIPGVGPIASAALMVGSTVLNSTLLKPKAPKTSPAAAERLMLSIDPAAPRKIWFGHTAGNTDLFYQAATGSNQEYYEQIVVVAAHEATAIDEIWFDTELAWTSAGGAQGRFAGYLTITTRLVGTSSNGIAIDANWTSACTLTGCAYYHAKFKLTGNSSKAASPFANGVPSRVTVRGKGAKVYDPRFDSTAGGSGAQRITDQSTWAYSTGGVESGRNPALQDLWYATGWRINNLLSVGRGLPAARISIPSYVTGANLCDESVAKAGGGTEPRYRSDGVFSEADDPSTVFSSLHAAMAAEHTDENGKLALRIEHNDLASPVVDLTQADIIGDDHWLVMPADEPIPNVVRGRYTDASNASLYQQLPAPKVALASPDGIDRNAPPFDPLTVQSASQWQRLAKMWLQKKQYPELFTANFNARAWAASYGKIVTLNHAALGFNLTFRVIYQKVGRGGVVRMILRRVDPSMYAWDAEESAPVAPAAPIPFNPVNHPFVQAIEEAGTTAEWPNIEDPDDTKPEDKAEQSASVVLETPTVTINRTNDGVIKAGQLGEKGSIARYFKAGSALTSGLSWTYRVLTGTINGYTNASGAIAISGSGSVNWLIASMGTPGGTVEIVGVAGSNPARKAVLTIVVVDDQQPTAGGSGGGSGGTSSTQSVDTSTNSTSPVAISPECVVDVGSAGTVGLTATSIQFMPLGPGTGTWDCYIRWQWHNGSTWVEIGTGYQSAQSDTDSDGESSVIKSPAFVTHNMTHTNSAGATGQRYRLAGYIGTSKNHAITGSINAQG